MAVLGAVAALAFVSVLPTASAAAIVDLGTAGPFAILAGSEVTNTGVSVIDGDIGVHPGSSVTGFESATVNGDFHIADAVADQAKSDLSNAYDDAAGRVPTMTLATDLGEELLAPGVYESESGTFGLTGAVTLDAGGDQSAVWIFQMASTLITASDSSVVLLNGAQACNVFWQVGSSATLGSDTDFQGNILAQASITMNNGATLQGRALAQTEAVTLDNNVITSADCAPDEEPPGEGPSIGCSTDLGATANEDTSIKLTWTPVEGADQHRIYRAEGDGGFMLQEEVEGNASSFVDTDTNAGVTYRYMALPVAAGTESEGCQVVEVTAIPFFPGFLAGALALVGGVAAYAFRRRRI